MTTEPGPEPDQDDRPGEQRAGQDVDRGQSFAAHQEAGRAGPDDRSQPGNRRDVPDRALVAAEQVDGDHRQEHVERTQERDRAAEHRHDGEQPSVADHGSQAGAELLQQALARATGARSTGSAARPSGRTTSTDPSVRTAIAP